jgi:chromate reductase, NAD(P)H dehydrogenase (quinone)
VPSPRPRLRFVGLSGSLRDGSANTALLAAAAELAPDDVEVVIHPLGDVPLFDADLEAAGLPLPVAELRDSVAAADGLLLATPEYNWSVSGVLKNAIDWLSRGSPAPIDHKPTAMLSGAGRSGGRRAQAHLVDILRHNAVDVLDEAVQVPTVSEHVIDGDVVTPEVRDEVAAVVAALRARVRERRDDAEVA